jgi:hypothetical protein
VFYRSFAVFMLLIGMYIGVQFVLTRYVLQETGYPGEISEVLDTVVRIYIPAIILYCCSGYLARVTVWKMKT